MAVIAVYSVKGGVGKTTISANLAWCSAVISRRQTLLWDLDASGGAGFLYDIEPRKKARADSIFASERKAADLARKTPYSRLHVLPADESLRAIDRTLLQIGKRKRLSKMTLKLSKEYERVILDCPPVLSELSAQILRAADIVIVPLPPSPLSRRAFDVVVREMRAIGKKRPAILPVMSMVDMRRTLHRDMREEMPDWPVIPFASTFERSAVEQTPVGALAPRSSAALSVNQLWTAIERKLAER